MHVHMRACVCLCLHYWFIIMKHGIQKEGFFTLSLPNLNWRLVRRKSLQIQRSWHGEAKLQMGCAIQEMQRQLAPLSERLAPADHKGTEGSCEVQQKSYPRVPRLSTYHSLTALANDRSGFHRFLVMSESSWQKCELCL